MKISESIKKETLFLAVVEIILTAIMFAVFLIFKKFSVSVLLGGIIGSVLVLLNFFVMCLSIQKATGVDDVKTSKNIMRASQALRTLALLALFAVCLAVLKTNVISTLVPVIFPRISVFIRQIMLKKEDKKTN